MAILNRRAASLFIGALASLALSGCLNFKQQTIVVKFDGDSGKVTCLLVYEGIHVERGLFQKKDEALAGAKKQLSEFVASEQEFYLFGWPFHIALNRQPDDTEPVAPRRRKFAAQLQVKNGAFLLDERKELCGYQIITIHDREKFSREFNETMSQLADDAMTEELSKPRDAADKSLSEESKRLIQRAAREGHDWIKLSPGKLAIDLPMTRGDAEKILVELENDKSSREALRKFRETVPGFQITPSDHGLLIALGDGKGHVFRMQTSGDDDTKGLFPGELLDYARTLRADFDRPQDTKALIRKFSSTP